MLTSVERYVGADEMVKHRDLEDAVVGFGGLVQCERVAAPKNDVLAEVGWCAIEKEIHADDLLGEIGVVVEHAAVADVEQTPGPGDLAVDGVANFR